MGRYARYYTFSLSQETDLVVDLTSTQDPYLFLLEGAGKEGEVEAQNDDVESGNTDSRLTITVGAGSYTLEATTFNASVTGDFTLSIAGPTEGSSSGGPEPVTDPCVEELGTLTATTTRTGSWASQCGSENREGKFARYYTFRLSQETDLVIDLTSTQDPYLFLLEGAGKEGDVKAENDDVESGNRNSRITMTVAADSYTLEVTTYGTAVTGDFTLSIAGPKEDDASTEPQPEGDPCVENLGTLTATTTRTGSWASDCESTNREGRYARYYTFTLGQETDLEIDLTSTEDPYLFLLAGAGKGGNVEEENDDVESGNRNSRVTISVQAGTYTLEATTYNAAATGDFTLAIAGPTDDSSTIGPEPDPESDPCVENLGTLTGAASRTGTWTSGCGSQNREGRYARYYTFNLSQETDLVVDLTSAEDTYLFLLEGAGKEGDVEGENDDVESGNTNSRLTITVGAGTYTVEATTYSEGATGDFTLRIAGPTEGGATTEPEPGDSSCVEDLGTLTENTSRTGSWTSGCGSENRDGRYARYYTFTVSGETDLVIDLTSSEDPYLFLLAGSGREGEVVGENDDVESSNRNSRLTITVEAGRYTVEATTYNEGATGDFTVGIEFGEG